MFIIIMIPGGGVGMLFLPGPSRCGGGHAALALLTAWVGRFLREGRSLGQGQGVGPRRGEGGMTGRMARVFRILEHAQSETPATRSRKNGEAGWVVSGMASHFEDPSSVLHNNNRSSPLSDQPCEISSWLLTNSVYSGTHLPHPDAT